MFFMHVKIPFIDSILLNILELLKQKFSQIDKRGVQIRSGPKINKWGGTFIKHQRVSY